MARDDPGAVPEAGSNLTPAYVRVLLIEAVVLAALYAIGRHFA